MGQIFGGAPKVSAPVVPPPAPPPPSRSDAEVAQAAEDERRRRRALLGRSSTIKTGDEGVTGAAPTARATLLGGSSQATGS